MDKILSIIIPTYNMEHYLRHCLDSLIVPDMKKVEVLVVNDGSKDSSLAIAHEYESRFSETFRVIDKENGNYGSCINRGLKEATGKYIKILDADDSYDTSFFEDFLQTLSKIDVDVVLNDFIFVNKEGKKTCVKPLKDAFSDIPQNKSFDFDKFTKSHDNYASQMHCTTYRRDIFNRFAYHQTEGISYTDQQWIFAPYQFVKTAYYFPHALYLYLLGREGQTMDASNHVRHLDQLMMVVKDMADVYEALPEDCLNYSMLAHQLNGQISACYANILTLTSDLNDCLATLDKHLSGLTKVQPRKMLVAHNLVDVISVWRKHHYHFPSWFRFFMKVYERYVAFRTA